MAELRPHYIDVDLKKNTQYNVPVVTQNDTATHFIIRVTDDGLSDPELLDAYQEITMTSQRPDGESFYLTGTRIPGTNEIEFHLGTDETAFSGSVLASLQFYLVEDASRYTSAQFRYDVKKDLTTNYTPTQREETLVEVVLKEGPGVIQEAKDAKVAVDGALVELEQDKTAAIDRLDEVTEENKTIFREPVATFAALSTTYPNPEHGTTVRVTSEAASYRYSDGTWVKTDEYNPTAIDQVTAQLAETHKKSEQSIGWENIKQDARELMLGNSPLPIVGKNSVGKDNIVSGSVSLDKTDGYIQGILTKAEKINGSNAEFLIGEVSLNRSDYASVSAAGSPQRHIIGTPATDTGLLTIQFLSGGLASSSFLILNKTEHPLSSPLAFEVVEEIPFSTSEEDFQKIITIETDSVIKEGQYLGVQNGARIYRQNDGVGVLYYRQLSGGNYDSPTQSPLFYGRIGGRGGVISDIYSRLDAISPDDRLTVKNFGVVGDGVADDTVAFRNAITALAGGEIIMPPGQYKITGTLEIPSNTTVRGAGASTEIILGDGYSLESYIFRSAGDRFTPIMVTAPNSENITFKDFVIRGNKNTPDPTRQFGLCFSDTVNGLAENISVYDINYFETLMTNEDSPSGYNIATIRSQNIKIKGGIFTRGGYECVGVADDCEDIIVDGVFSGDAWRTSLQIHRGCKNVKVINCTIHQTSEYANAGLTTHGITGQSLKDILISNNSIYATARAVPEYQYNGTVQLMDGGLSEGYRITNNYIRGERTGIYMTQSKHNIVSGNDIECETGFGIYVPAICVDSIISGNIVNALNGENRMYSDSIIIKDNIGFDY